MWIQWKSLRVLKAQLSSLIQRKENIFLNTSKLFYLKKVGRYVQYIKKKGVQSTELFLFASPVVSFNAAIKNNNNKKKNQTRPVHFLYSIQNKRQIKIRTLPSTIVQKK